MSEFISISTLWSGVTPMNWVDTPVSQHTCFEWLWWNVFKSKLFAIF